MTQLSLAVPEHSAPRRRFAIRTGGAVACVVLLALILTACSDDQGQPASSAQSPLATLLLDTVPGGYTLNPQVSGPMGMETATTATPVDPTVLTRVLVTQHFQDAYSRIWQKGSAFVTALGYAFTSQPQAAALMAAEKSYLTTSLGVVVNPDPAVPGAWTYILYGPTRVKDRGVFCQGEWLGVDRYAVELSTCSDVPGSIDQVEQLASLQYAQLLNGTGRAPLPSFTPPPGY